MALLLLQNQTYNRFFKSQEKIAVPPKTTKCFLLKLWCSSILRWLSHIPGNQSLSFTIWFISETLPLTYMVMKLWFWMRLPGFTADLQHPRSQKFHEMHHTHMKVNMMLWKKKLFPSTHVSFAVSKSNSANYLPITLRCTVKFMPTMHMT